VLDVGCGIRPYYPYFEPYATEYVGVDVDNPAADLQGSVEELPVDDGAFDVVLCTQVLEHVAHPCQAVRELHRVTAPRGRVLASTHGVQVFHPAPTDFWRFTHTGLEKLFVRCGEWARVTVIPVGGAATCLGAMSAVYADLLLRRAHVPPLARASVWTLNTLGALVDSAVPALRRPGPGSLFLNFHIVAEKGAT
jgi:SAM-dependent methyltransferase